MLKRFFIFSPTSQSRICSSVAKARPGLPGKAGVGGMFLAPNRFLCDACVQVLTAQRWEVVEGGRGKRFRADINVQAILGTSTRYLEEGHNSASSN